MNRKNWNIEEQTVSESSSIEEVRQLAKAAQVQRQELASAGKVLLDMACEKRNSELFAAIKALENISIKALEIAAQVAIKEPTHD